MLPSSGISPQVKACDPSPVLGLGFRFLDFVLELGFLRIGPSRTMSPAPRLLYLVQARLRCLDWSGFFGLVYLMALDSISDGIVLQGSVDFIEVCFCRIHVGLIVQDGCFLYFLMDLKK